MRKVFTLLFVVLLIFNLCSCTKSAPSNYTPVPTDARNDETDISTTPSKSQDTANYTTSSPDPIQMSDTVLQHDIDFILDRKVFLPDMHDLYLSAISDYNTIFDADMTFRDLFNTTYFHEDTSSWEYLTKEDGITNIAFAGKAKGLSDDIPIVVGFGWSDTATSPLVMHFIFGIDANGNRNEWSATSIQEKYGHDLFSAVALCDSTFSCLIASSLLEPSDTATQEKTTEATQHEYFYNWDSMKEDCCYFPGIGLSGDPTSRIYTDFLYEYYALSSVSDRKSTAVSTFLKDKIVLMGPADLPNPERDENSSYELMQITFSDGKTEIFAVQLAEPSIPTVYRKTDEALIPIWSVDPDIYYDWDTMYHWDEME